MAKNTGKVREFCQSGKVGTLPVIWVSDSNKFYAFLWDGTSEECMYDGIYQFFIGDFLQFMKEVAGCIACINFRATHSA